MAEPAEMERFARSRLNQARRFEVETLGG